MSAKVMFGMSCQSWVMSAELSDRSNWVTNYSALLVMHETYLVILACIASKECLKMLFETSLRFGCVQRAFHWPNSWQSSNMVLCRLWPFIPHWLVATIVYKGIFTKTVWKKTHRKKLRRIVTVSKKISYSL